MASKVLDRCITTLGDERSKLHRIIYDYELLEDQFIIPKWLKGETRTYIHPSLIDRICLCREYERCNEDQRQSLQTHVASVEQKSP
jgi:hypothetical protein